MVSQRSKMKLIGRLFVIAAVTSVNSVAADNAAEIGKKLNDPTSLVWALFTEIDYNWKGGDIVNGTKTDQAITFQPIMPFKLTKNWKLLTRPTIALVNTHVPGEINQNGYADFDDTTGLSNFTTPLMLSPMESSKSGFGWGAGPTVQMPTATKSELGADVWAAGPALLGLYKTPEIMGGLVGQYWWSVVEQGNTASTSNGSLLYFFYYNLPNAWQIGSSSTITYNDKAASDDQWNVPISILGAKTMFIGKVPVKFQFGLDYSVIYEDTYAQQWRIKLNIIPVIKSWFPNVIFD